MTLYKVYTTTKKYYFCDELLKYVPVIKELLSDKDKILLYTINSDNMDIIIDALNHIVLYGNLDNYDLEINLKMNITHSLFINVLYVGFNELFDKLLQVICNVLNKELNVSLYGNMVNTCVNRYGTTITKKPYQLTNSMMQRTINFINYDSNTNNLNLALTFDIYKGKLEQKDIHGCIDISLNVNDVLPISKTSDGNMTHMTYFEILMIFDLDNPNCIVPYDEYIQNSDKYADLLHILRHHTSLYKIQKYIKHVSN